MSVQKQNPSIPEFFEGKSVFVTGGMGFLGKVLIEKLLRSCPGVENIYMLCRSKKGKNVNERLEEITESPVFDELRKKNPDAFNKIILIEGDVAMLELGISKTDQELLKEKISVVMHSAATINFNEPLKIAVNTNLRSMRELLILARQMTNLKSFVHLSTAYTNWYELDVKEEVYPQEFDPHDIISLCERLPDKTIDKLTPVLLGKHLTTYTFTKNLAENLVQKEVRNLPIAIVRPSMVSASMDEPKPGWIDSYASATGFMYCTSNGSFRTLHHIKGHPFDIVPVDLVINQSIATAWKVALEKASNSPTQFPMVYHSAAGDVNPITLQDLFYKARDYGRTKPYYNILWFPKMRMYESGLLHNTDYFITHMIPAYLYDFASKLAGKKQRFVKNQKAILRNYDAVRFACIHPYIFQMRNYNNIWSIMSQADKKNFNFEPKSINYSRYVEDYNMGIKEFLIKEKPKDPAVKMARMTKMKYINYLFLGSVAVTGAYVLTKIGTSLFRCKNKNEEISPAESQTS